LVSFQACKDSTSINVIEHANRKRDKNRKIMSIDAEDLYKIHHTFMKKVLKKPGVEEMYLSIIKAIYDKPITKIILNGGKLKAFTLSTVIQYSA
jgi:hypothetical protein